jgi:hypothetical protein
MATEQAGNRLHGKHGVAPGLGGDLKSRVEPALAKGGGDDQEEALRRARRVAQPKSRDCESKCFFRLPQTMSHMLKMLGSAME